jgi:hypothetical protein
MQGVLVFANATARDAAITSPQEGQFAYLKDTNVTTYYTGSAWANLDTTGMTNPMTTTGDMVYSSSGSTPARLGIGTAGQVLKVNSGATAPEWGAAGGAAGLTKITSATFSAVSSVSFANGTFSSTYKDYLVQFNVTNVSANINFQGRMRASGSDATGNDYFDATLVLTHGNTQANRANSSANKFDIGYVNSGTDQFSRAYNFISPQIATRTRIWGGGLGVTPDYVTNTENDTQLMHHNLATSYDSFTFIASGGNMTGYYAVYGLEA